MQPAVGDSAAGMLQMCMAHAAHSTDGRTRRARAASSSASRESLKLRCVLGRVGSSGKLSHRSCCRIGGVPSTPSSEHTARNGNRDHVFLVRLKQGVCKLDQAVALVLMLHWWRHLASTC